MCTKMNIFCLFYQVIFSLVEKVEPTGGNTIGFIIQHAPSWFRGPWINDILQKLTRCNKNILLLIFLPLHYILIFVQKGYNEFLSGPKKAVYCTEDRILKLKYPRVASSCE